MAKWLILLLLPTFLAACSESTMYTVEDLQAEDALNQPEDAGGDNSQTEIPSDEAQVPVVKVPGAPDSAIPDFYLNTSIISLAHDKAQFWEGCQSKQLVQGGYESDTVCGKAYLQPAFAKALNRSFFSCVKRAAGKAGINEPVRAFIRHWGTYNDRNGRNSTNLSMHAYARAMDIVNFNLYDKDGKLTRIPTHVTKYSGSAAVFYDEFRDCWKSAMPSTCTSSSAEGIGSIGHPGSKLGGNTLHNDHLHLSYPRCAN